MKNKVIDTAFNVAIIAFLIGMCVYAYKQVEANRNLNQKIEVLQKHNKKISDEVDKLHKSIDAEIAKRLKETADKNHVGG
jgi:hypothetical protein|nr:MAG TPA: cell division protein [Caudoviricetes sp.]